MSKPEAKHGNKDSLSINKHLYKFYQKEAEYGCINAQFNLALSYENGEGQKRI